MLLESGGAVGRDSPHRAGDDLGPDRPAAGDRARPCCDEPPSRDGRSGRVRSMRSATLRPRRASSHELVERDFLVREPRSTIRGEEAYRFKHVLIRDVAYAGLSKSSRALLHRQMAGWLAGRHGSGRARRDPRLPPRRRRTARGRARGACLAGARGRGSGGARAGGPSGARARGERCCAAAPRRVRPSSSRTLERRYLAAHAAWRMTDFPTVSSEMHEVSEAAQRCGRPPDRGARADALARVALFRDADNACARELAGRALGVVEPDRRRRTLRRARGARHGLSGGRETSTRSSGSRNERLAIAERIGRADLQSGVLLELNDVYNARLETERAREPLARAIELAGASGSPTTRGWIASRVGPAGGARGPARRGRGRARGGARALRRERRGPDARHER